MFKSGIIGQQLIQSDIGGWQITQVKVCIYQAHLAPHRVFRLRPVIHDVLIILDGLIVLLGLMIMKCNILDDIDYILMIGKICQYRIHRYLCGLIAAQHDISSRQAQLQPHLVFAMGPVFQYLLVKLVSLIIPMDSAIVHSHIGKSSRYLRMLAIFGKQALISRPGLGLFAQVQ